MELTWEPHISASIHTQLASLAMKLQTLIDGLNICELREG